MALKSELLNLLEDVDEPLPKRLRIATDVFKSNKLPAFNKESILFNWFGKSCVKENTVEIWQTLHSCITSSQMNSISANDIKHEDLNIILKTIVKRLKHNEEGDIKDDIIKCVLAILKNDIFQKYLKYNLKLYCTLMSGVLINSNNINIVKEIISLKIIFKDKIIDKNEYANYFLTFTLTSLLQVLIKFQDENLHKDTFELLKFVLYNTDNFINYLSKLYETDSDNLNNHPIINTLNNLYNNETDVAKFGFKIIFSILLSLCKTEILRYQLFILILHIIGFKIKKIVNINLANIDENYHLDKSLEILAEIFEIMKLENVSIKESVSGKTFSDFVKSLIVSIIRIQIKPNLNTLKIIKNITHIDPLAIENIIDEVIMFVVSYKKSDDLEFLYSDLMKSIIKLYAKLNRMNKFCTIIFETVKNILFSQFKTLKPEIKFGSETKKKITNIDLIAKEFLPENVLQYLQECIMLQPNTVVVAIMSDFMSHLKDINTNFQTYTEDSKVVYIQILTELLCNFLSAVRIAEHTTSETHVNEFVTEMNVLRKELKQFGTDMLKVEHNHLLMFSFLNISYTWAELAILLTYYQSPDNLNFKGELDHDNSLHNLTYLHNYLSSEQWSLVSQRIKNFGELPCKHILQKLIIQKLRAILIFEDKVDESIESAIISNYALNLETSWDLILSDRIISTVFINKMDTSQLISLAEHFIKFLIKTNDFSIFQQRTIIDSRNLMTSIFYTCLSKIASLFKIKRKHKDSENIKPMCIKIFKSIDEESFITKEVVDIEKIVENFSDTFNNFKDLKINEESFCLFMEIIKCVPVLCLAVDVQITLFFFLLSICSDLKDCRDQNKKCLQKCEEYLIALVENLSSPNMFKYIKSDILIKQITESVNEYNTVLSFAIGKALTQNDSIPLYKAAISLLEKNVSDEKYYEIIIKTLHKINTASLKKVSEENKALLEKYKQKLLKKLLKCVIDKKECNLHAYTILLEHYLSNNCKETIQKLMTLINYYTDYARNNINEKNSEYCLELIKLILSKKNEILDIPEDFQITAWELCKKIKYVHKYAHFDKIITYLFEDISYNKFSTIVHDLLQSGIFYLKNNQTEDNINQIKIWKNLMNSKLGEEKQADVTNLIQILFQNINIYLTNNNNQEFFTEVVDFELRIIENQKILQSPTLIDVYFHTSEIIMSKEHSLEEFITAFEISFPILETLFMYRPKLLIDRLPTYLLHFRIFLHQLCLKSSLEVNLNEDKIRKLTNCSFRIEKLTKNLCTMRTDLMRITAHLIADFLKEYEKIPLYPSVKFHLDNCLYELIELCDEHAVKYLLRVLSQTSTELFKNIHHNYKTYYRYNV